ncbi:MAG TPA: hypothetical protein VFO15_19570, partial [Xanthobacteraceae bacterium]|nr:hypothetical protein [Xanthobacteraceae bacterium]
PNIRPKSETPDFGCKRGRDREGHAAAGTFRLFFAFARDCAKLFRTLSLSPRSPSEASLPALAIHQ